MYENFQKINGTHPWRDVSAEGYVDYPVYHKKGGRVIYFNFPLAREMGLIPKKHPRVLNTKLEKVILETFALQIINEHDWINKKRFPKDHHHENLFMATRYLQVQHQNKRGETSGDGRSIWNGYIVHNGRIYDISSRGTGSTILSPGVVEAGEHLETGSENYGYSSGLADLDEMLGSAIMSEIFYREGIPTERCLAVIEFKDKTSVGVRTAPNLIRPAHLFRYLKLGMNEELKNSFDYFVDRQIKNKVWDLPKSGKTRYLKALEFITRLYARLAAILEVDYIFNWFAWDGDNMLASGAILDYGSIRQFAAKHNKYRYEDDDRFSTTLTEQKGEARRIIQTFVQAVDFILTGEKKNLKNFDEDKMLELFDQSFDEEKNKRLLWRIGFTKKQIEKLMARHRGKVDQFRDLLNYFEQIKTAQGETKVPDGIDHPPVFVVRRILRELPRFLLRNLKDKELPLMVATDFCDIMAASYVTQEDLIVTESRAQKIDEFQEAYWKLVNAVTRRPRGILRTLAERSGVINYEYRRTGDGLTWIVNEAIMIRNRIGQQRLQAVIERFIKAQVLIPGKWKPIRKAELDGDSMKAKLLRKMQENLQIYNEQI
ncbi:MAG: YdiU family protein [Candidatus Omnitrophica bacterium]|nr:YdiU family protein [Candidatus Omnitrophota bacterium]